MLLVWKYCGCFARTWYWVCVKRCKGLFGDTLGVSLTSECRIGNTECWIGKGMALSASESCSKVGVWFLVLEQCSLTYCQMGSFMVTCSLTVCPAATHSRMLQGLWSPLGNLGTCGRTLQLGAGSWWAIRGTWQGSAQSTSLCCSGECDMAKKEWSWMLDQEICIFTAGWITYVSLTALKLNTLHWIWKIRSQCQKQPMPLCWGKLCLSGR